jgi:hypothetical protein
MSLALLLLNGQAILVYRGFRRVEKIYTKKIHAAVQLAGLLIAVLGLKAGMPLPQSNSFLSFR